MNHRADGVLRESQLDALAPPAERLSRGPFVVVECIENIPCNPCVAACPKGAITIDGDINEVPVVDFDACDGCGVCISACPGLAIFAVDLSGERGLVSLPFEYLPLPEIGETVEAIDRRGEIVCEATVTRVLSSKALDRTPIVTLEVPRETAMSVRHFRRKGSSR